MDVLVEVHTEAELQRALAAGARLLGINNRNLHTFETDLAVTEELLPLVPPGVVVISESGVKSQDDVRRLVQHGARGVLVGESLMRSADKGDAIRALKGAHGPCLTGASARESKSAAAPASPTLRSPSTRAPTRWV